MAHVIISQITARTHVPFSPVRDLADNVLAIPRGLLRATGKTLEFIGDVAVTLSFPCLLLAVDAAHSARTERAETYFYSGLNPMSFHSDGKWGAFLPNATDFMRDQHAYSMIGLMGCTYVSVLSRPVRDLTYALADQLTVK